MSGNEASPDRAAWRGLLWPGAFTFVALVVLAALGVWQLQRLAWKEDLVARIEAHVRAEPEAMPPEAAWAATRWADAEYRPLLVSGTFLHEQELLVQANAVIGGGGVRMGAFVLTPLRLDEGGIVFVNRGFIPVELTRDAAAFAAWQREDRAQADAPVTVAGLLRAPQQRGWFVPQDAPDKGQWFVRDPAAFAAALGLERVAPFTIDAFRDPEREGWPVGGLTVVSFPNNHLDYAFTWFGLAVVLAVIFVMFAHRRLTGR